MMEGWKTDKLKNYISVESGYAFKTEDFSTTGIPVVKIGNIVDNTTKPTNGDSYIRKEDLSLYENYIIREGDVLIAMSGNTTCKMGRVSKAFSPSLVNQRVGWIKPLNSEINIDFVYYLLQSESYQNKLWNYATATGQPNLSPRDICKINFYKPTLSEQTAIASMLSKVDEAIAVVQASISAAERLKKSLMQNLLTGRMKPDGTLRTEEEFYLDEKFGRVPVGWEVKRLGYLFSIKAGGDLQEDYYSPIKDGTHAYPVFSNSLDNNGLYGYTSNPRFHAKESVTITGRGGVGHPEYRQGDYDAIIRLISLIPLQPDTIDCKYVCYYIGHYVHFALESTGVPQLTCPKVFSTKIMIPIDVKEQNKIGEMIHHFDAYIKEKQNKIAVLERLKKSLMQNLLTGRVRVRENY